MKGNNILEKLRISKNYQSTENLGIKNGICFETEENEPENLLTINSEECPIFLREADRDICLSAPEMLEGHINIMQMIKKFEDENMTAETALQMIKVISLNRCEKATVKPNHGQK